MGSYKASEVLLNTMTTLVRRPFCHTEKAVSDTYIPIEMRRGQNCNLPIRLLFTTTPRRSTVSMQASSLLWHKELQLSRLTMPPDYSTFKVFSDYTFLENSILLPKKT